MFGFRRIIAFIIIAVLVAGGYSAHAAGTAAGVDISSTAVATYQYGGSEYFSKTSNTVVFTVAEVLDVAVSLQSATEIYVASGASDQVLTFRVTNTGNGNENFLLSVDNSQVGDAFDPVLAGIYRDSNDNGLYDAGVDALITETGDLAADAAMLMFVVNNIPASGVTDEDQGYSSLMAEAATGSGVAGTVFAAAGDGGIDAVVGSSGAIASYTGIYTIADIFVTLAKSSVVLDSTGGSRPETGAVITYSLVVSTSGTGTAEAITITDPIPANTTYLPNSLELDASSGTGSAYVSLTDSDDADAADFGITNTDAITVHLGDLPGSSADQFIRFKVIID